MKYLTQKINRYKSPSFIILITVALPILLREFVSHPTTDVVFAIMVIVSLNVLIYLLFIATIGRLIVNDFVSILIDMGLSFLLIGIMFRIMHWPGAVMQITEGILFIVIGLSSLIYLKFKIH
ncbi:MAG: hypothetical protein H0W84_04775 [Bacteroidetes bacterium]|nr:hypothetical protein [Bacteroidota bacterium]